MAATASPPRKTGRQAQRRRDSDRRMIEAAMALFAEHGYRGTTLVQIGARAGCTGTLVSNRFGSKAGLLRAVLAHILNRFVADEAEQDAQAEALAAALDAPSPELRERRTGAGRPAGDEDAADALRRFVADYLRDVGARQDRVRALYAIMGEALAGLPEIGDEVVKVNVVFRNRVARLIADGVASGAFRADLDIDNAALLVVGLLRGVTQQVLAEPATFEATALIGEIQEAVLTPLLAGKIET